MERTVVLAIDDKLAVVQPLDDKTPVAQDDRPATTSLAFLKIN